MNQYLTIQKALTDYREILSSISKTNYHYNYMVVAAGSKVCEAMLLFIVKEQGLPLYRNSVRIGSTNVFCPIIRLFDFKYDFSGFPEEYAAKLKESRNQIIAEIDIPLECLKFIHLIIRGKEYITSLEVLLSAIVGSYIRAIDYFFLWFKRKYVDESDTDTKLKTKVSKSFFSVYEIVSNNRTVYIEQENNGLSMKDLLEKINEQTSIIIKLSSRVAGLEETGHNVERIVSDINQQLNQLNSQICSYQELVEKQLRLAQSDNEAETILHTFTEECTRKIIEVTSRQFSKKSYQEEKQKLVHSFGEKAWNKLDESSMSFLISSKVMYNRLILLNDAVDYSGVCLLVTKALERELKKRLFTRFLVYLNSKYGQDFKKYPTALLDKSLRPISDEKFSLGRIPFILVLYSNAEESTDVIENNRHILLDFCKEDLFIETDVSRIEETLHYFAKVLEEVRVKYRNPSAHMNSLKQKDAESCFNLILGGRQILKKMLDTFKY